MNKKEYIRQKQARAELRNIERRERLNIAREADGERRSELTKMLASFATQQTQRPSQRRATN